jgi:long-chain fatty acid transport protein
MTKARMGILVGAALATLGLSSQAAAQTNDDVFPQLRWNFATPGARANGMGQAFIGVADDATAAVTNPAGLMRFTRPQIYLEYKNTDLKVQRFTNPDSLFTQQPTTFTTNVSSPSFLNVALPLGRRVTIAFSRHEFLNYKESFHRAPQAIPPAATFLFFPVTGDDSFKGTSYGESLAVSLGDKFDIGVTVSENQLKAQSTATRYNFRIGPTFNSNRSDVSETSIIVNQSSLGETVTAIAFSVGAIVRPNQKVSIGFEYSRGPSFKLSEDLKNNPGERPDFAPGPCCGTNLPLIDAAGSPFTLSINVPDRFGGGVSVRPVPRLLLAVDAVRINYSRLVKDFTVIFEQSVLTGQEFAIDDVTEIHLGGEVNVSTGKIPLFLRAGVFTNPDHSVRFLGTRDANANASGSATYNLLPRNTEINGTFGGGFAVGQHFQLDVAYVGTVSPTALRGKKDIVLSAAVRF